MKMKATIEVEFETREDQYRNGRNILNRARTARSPNSNAAIATV
jgi:hypothetical protein